MARAQVGYVDAFYRLVLGSETRLIPLPHLAFSGRLITLTIGIRFLTDYLAGDTYFRTAYEDHNLVRCHTQFKMVESMEEQSAEYEAIVRRYS